MRLPYNDSFLFPQPSCGGVGVILVTDQESKVQRVSKAYLGPQPDQGLNPCPLQKAHSLNYQNAREVLRSEFRVCQFISCMT